MFNAQDKVVCITAGTSGIGLASAGFGYPLLGAVINSLEE